MPRSKKDVIRCLLKKGFTEEPKRDHIYFTVHGSDGRKTIVYTKVSHGSGKDISDGLLSAMRKQMRLEKREFEEYMNCSLSKEDYLRILKEKGLYW